ncbi:hypothetical protein Avbf_18667 [Armadillidium vulgare]|nr:hypothetical protein Avbf_18667 [Armadillidium vulgare]
MFQRGHFAAIPHSQCQLSRDKNIKMMSTEEINWIMVTNFRNKRLRSEKGNCSEISGGIRAVVWTDVFQFSAMLIGMIAIVGVGIVENEGIVNILYTSSKGERLGTL